MKSNNKMTLVLTEAQMHYYQTTNVGKGTGEIVGIDWSESVEPIAEENGIDSSESAETIDFEGEFTNQVFSAEFINQINKERAWTGGVVVAETDLDSSDGELL